MRAQSAPERRRRPRGRAPLLRRAARTLPAAALAIALPLLGSGASAASPAAPPAASAQASVVVAQEQVALVPGRGIWRVLDLMTLVDTGKRAVRQVTAWVPPQSLRVRIRNGLSGLRVAPDGDVLLGVDLAPGRSAQVAFSYLLPGTTLHLAWHVPVAALRLVLLVPQGSASVSGPDFRFAGSTRVGSMHLDGYVTDTPSAGSVLDLTVRPGAPAGGPPLWAVAGAAGVLLAGTVALVLVRRRRGAPPAAPDLVEAIAALDAALQRGEVAADEHRTRREDLLDRLMGLGSPGVGVPLSIGASGPVTGPVVPAPATGRPADPEAGSAAGRPPSGTAPPVQPPPV